MLTARTQAHGRAVESPTEKRKKMWGEKLDIADVVCIVRAAGE